MESSDSPLPSEPEARGRLLLSFCTGRVGARKSGLRHMARGRKYGSGAVMPKTSRPPDRTEALSIKGTFSIAEALVWITFAILFAFSLVTLYYPMVRAFYRFEINFNEGWNVYIAQTAMQHRALYPAKHGGIGVAYPFLSFYSVGYVSHFFGDYLLAGRLISLVAFLLSCVLVGLIVKRLTNGWGPAVFGGVFCLGLFCSRMPNYVGMDDPQMFAHPFFLFGLWLYLQAVPSTLRIAGITSLFILGGNIKHNLLPAPLSVFSDLFTTSLSKAIRFVVFGVFFLASSIAVNMLVGGPSFVSYMVLSRAYSFAKVRDTFFSFYSPQGLPLAISAFWSIWQYQNRQARVICFYFFSSLLIGAAFAGGAGVNVNTFFDNLFAMSIIMGACLDSLWKAPIPSLGGGGRWRFMVPVLLYLTVVMTYVPRGVNMPKLVSDLPLRQRLFDQEVSFLVAQPGPAICENLLLCYDAGKPYVLSPFGLAMRAGLGKGSNNELMKQIAEKKYGAIQTYVPVTQRPYSPTEMGVGNSFPDDVLDVIDRYYVEALKGPDCHIYVPRVVTSNPPRRDE
jgi:hypothetical protein